MKRRYTPAAISLTAAPPRRYNFAVNGLISAAFNWRPRPPFYYGWLVLGAAALGAFVATGVAQTVLGGVQDLIAEDMGWPRSTIAFAATAGTWASGLTMPFVGRLVDRYGPRLMMAAAALVVGCCYLALGGVNSLWQFCLAYVIARALAGPNLQNVVPRTVAVNFFRRKRNLALGITAQNRISGEALNLLIITMTAAAFSWRAAYRALGAMALPLAIPLFIVMRRKPEDIGLLPDGDKPTPPRPQRPSPRQSADAAQTAAPPPQTEFDWRVREVIRIPAFWRIVWAEFLAVSMTAAVAFQLVPFLTDSGMPYAAAAGALMLSVLLGGLSVPLWGHLSDKFTIKRLTIAALAATVVPTAAFAALTFQIQLPLVGVIDIPAVGFYLSIAWGVASGGLPVVGSMMLGHYFGRASFGALTGLTGPFRTAAMGLGPSLGALLYDATGGYGIIFAAAIVAYIAAIALNWGVQRPPPAPRP